MNTARPWLRGDFGSFPVFVEAEQLSDTEVLRADLCIIGTGPAGLSVLQPLLNTSLEVILLESGGLARDDARSDALNRGVSDLGDYPFTGARARAFGGTSTLWNGACLPLEPEDFEARDWVPHSGWPIGPDDLAPFLGPARALFGMVEDGAFAARLAASPFHGDGLEARVVQYSGPRDLGQSLRRQVAEAPRVRCVTGATVTTLDVPHGGQAVTGVVFRDLTSRVLRVQAGAVVLATGGIETPRLLLQSDAVVRGGVGNARGVVGRYHMEHPMRSIGMMKVGRAARKLTPFTDLTPAGTAALEGTFGLSAARREALGLLNMHVRAYRYNRLESRPEIVEAKRAAASAKDAPSRALDLVRTLGPRGLAPGAVYGAWHVWNKTLATAWFDRVRMIAFLEQEPDPENRITLSETRDMYGCRLPHLAWRESATMAESEARTYAALTEAFGARGFGEIEIGTEASAHLSDYSAYGLHHMGATRMSDDPAQGVVDRDCRVHGVENLYVAGSSVFPTGGAANPTLTISALGFRLGDHLAQKLPTGQNRAMVRAGDCMTSE